MNKVAVIGLGTMGPGIAATLARCGMTVTAYDANADQRAKAKDGFGVASGVLDALGVPNQQQKPPRVTETLQDCVAGVDLAIENVPENLELKQQVFREIEALVSQDCIIASDTSGIPVTKIQDAVAHPERVVG